MSFCVRIFRLAYFFSVLKIPLLPTLLDYFIRFVFSCWMPHTVKAGKRLTLGYGGLGVVVHNNAVLGENVHIDQNVTIGGNATDYGAPVIGDNVYIGAGAKIVGPITVGSNCVIAANAVVVKNVPDGCVVAGVPAKVIKTNIQLETFLYHLSNGKSEL